MNQIKIKLSGAIVEGKGPDRLKNIVAQTIDKVLPTLRTEVAQKTPVGVSGKLRAGVSYKRKSWHEGLVYEKSPGSKYVEVVEKGRGENKTPPPYKPINLWLRRTDRGKAFVAVIKKEYGLSNKKALEKATFIKCRAIGKYGIKKVEMFKETHKEREAWVVSMFKKALRQF